MKHFLSSIFILIVLLAAPAAGADEVIAEYKGSGAHNTKPFEASGPWKIQWSAEGYMLQIHLKTMDDKLVDILAFQMAAGSGSKQQLKPGRYFLHVNTDGKWSIKIVKSE